jgi:hypothetical protein
VFSSYWFAQDQKQELNALARAIQRLDSQGASEEISNVFRLALSRTIITKSGGATLAADVSHSRPHKVKFENDYDVIGNFNRFAISITNTVNAYQISYPAQVKKDDARLLTTIEDSSIDAIITSPPYLNAIDYIRGHRLSLIWLGHRLPDLRKLRSDNVGTERSLPETVTPFLSKEEVASYFPMLTSLPQRKLAMSIRYITDLASMCSQFSRVLKKGSSLHVVIGNSMISGVFVPNSRIFSFCAIKHGFSLTDSCERIIPENKRYLPINQESNALQNRMRTEVVMSFVRS